MKEKGKRKELAGKKPTKFNSTKFVEYSCWIREGKRTWGRRPLEEYEKEKELIEDKTEGNTLSCNVCKKILASEKGLKIHMKKTQTK